MKANPRSTYFYSNIVGIDDLIDVQAYLKQYFEYFTENKTFPKKDDRFMFLKSVINLALLPAIIEFS